MATSAATLSGIIVSSVTSCRSGIRALRGIGASAFRAVLFGCNPDYLGE